MHAQMWVMQYGIVEAHQCLAHVDATDIQISSSNFMS